MVDGLPRTWKTPLAGPFPTAREANEAAAREWFDHLTKNAIKRSPGDLAREFLKLAAEVDEKKLAWGNVCRARAEELLRGTFKPTREEIDDMNCPPDLEIRPPEPQNTPQGPTRSRAVNIRPLGPSRDTPKAGKRRQGGPTLF